MMRCCVHLLVSRACARLHTDVKAIRFFLPPFLLPPPVAEYFSCQNWIECGAWYRACTTLQSPAPPPMIQVVGASESCKEAGSMLLAGSMKNNLLEGRANGDAAYAAPSTPQVDLYDRGEVPGLYNAADNDDDDLDVWMWHRKGIVLVPKFLCPSSLMVNCAHGVRWPHTPVQMVLPQRTGGGASVEIMVLPLHTHLFKIVQIVQILPLILQSPKEKSSSRGLCIFAGKIWTFWTFSLHLFISPLK